MKINTEGAYYQDLDIDNIVDFVSYRVWFRNITPPIQGISWCHFVCIPMNRVTNVEARQEIYTHSGEAYYRIRWDGTWRAWNRLDNFGCATLAELKTALASV